MYCQDLEISLGYWTVCHDIKCPYHNDCEIYRLRPIKLIAIERHHARELAKV
jgi:hypothetical protein